MVDEPQDFVIATGRTSSLEHFVAEAFRQLGLEWRRHVDVDTMLFRPSEIQCSMADPARAHRDLSWRAHTLIEDVIARLIAHEQKATPEHTE